MKCAFWPKKSADDSDFSHEGKRGKSEIRSALRRALSAITALGLGSAASLGIAHERDVGPARIDALPVTHNKDGASNHAPGYETRVSAPAGLRNMASPEWAVFAADHDIRDRAHSKAAARVFEWDGRPMRALAIHDRARIVRVAHDHSHARSAKADAAHAGKLRMLRHTLRSHTADKGERQGQVHDKRPHVYQRPGAAQRLMVRMPAVSSGADIAYSPTQAWTPGVYRDNSASPGESGAKPLPAASTGVPFNSIQSERIQPPVSLESPAASDLQAVARKRTPSTLSDATGETTVSSASATGANSVALGGHALASGSQSSAFGDAATATANDSVALGSNSQADREHSVSVGAAGRERQITNVAAGTAPTDAVNLAQLNGAIGGMRDRIDDVERTARRGIAAVSALNVVTPYLPGRTTLNAGVSGYRGQAAFGIGVSRWNQKGTVNYNLGVATAGGDSTVVRVGIGIVFNV